MSIAEIFQYIVNYPIPFDQIFVWILVVLIGTAIVWLPFCVAEKIYEIIDSIGFTNPKKKLCLSIILEIFWFALIFAWIFYEIGMGDTFIKFTKVDILFIAYIAILTIGNSVSMIEAIFEWRKIKKAEKKLIASPELQPLAKYLKSK